MNTNHCWKNGNQGNSNNFIIHHGIGCFCKDYGKKGVQEKHPQLIMVTQVPKEMLLK